MLLLDDLHAQFAYQPETSVLFSGMHQKNVTSLENGLEIAWILFFFSFLP